MNVPSPLGGRYVLGAEIGRGGMAVVYRALDQRYGRDVAVKVLHREIASAVGPDRFLKEIQTAARLNHPHIIPLQDSGEAEGFLYYVMPFIEGQTCGSAFRLRSGFLSRRLSPWAPGRCPSITLTAVG